MNKFFLLTVSVLAMFLAGCKVTVTGGTATKLDYANQFVNNLTNDPLAYDYFFLEKTYTIRGGGWIVVEDDFGDVRAIDIYSLVRDTYAYDLDYFTDHSRPVYYNGGNVWIDNYGNLYDQEVSSKKDLEKVAAQLEVLKVEAMGESLSEKFGLSEERGLQIAKLVGNWKKVSKTRGMTNADADSFSKKLLGFDITAGMKAMENFKTGDSKPLDKLIEQAAKTNGISPEQMNTIIKDIMVQ